VLQKDINHLKLYEDKGNLRAPPTPKVENIERIKIVPFDDGWLEYEEQVFDF
jgi:hypothetical protein